MTGKDLKNALLQEAVQGKLVPPACRQAGKLQAKIPSAKDGQWFVYVIECEDGSFYKGFTTDLQKRYEQHCNGTGADWTKTHKPKQLYYWEIHYSEESALQREKYLKSGVGREWFKNEVVDKPENWSSARDLLEEIRKEKSKLIKEGKLKKEKPLPEIKEEDIPFDIPENWCWCRLGELVDTNIGLTYSPSDIITEGGTEVLRSNNIQNGKIVYDNLVHVSKNVPEKCLSKKGDLLICARNGSKALVGKSALIEQDGMAFGAFMAIVRSPINPYILHFINSPVYRAKLDGVNTTTINQITQDNLRETVFPLPPLAEQKRIVAAIEKFMPLIEEYGKKETELKALNEQIGTLTKKAILQEAVQGKLVPTCLPAGRQIVAEGNAKDLLEEIKKEKAKLVKEGKLKKEKLLTEITEDEIPFEIPESWCWCRLSEYIDIRDGTHDSPKFYDTGVPFVTSKNLDNGTLDFSSSKFISEEDHKKFSARSFVEDGDILFAMIGSIGNPVIVKKEFDFSFKNMALFKRYFKEKTNMQYIFYYLSYIQTELKKIATGGVQSFIGLGTFREMLFPLPPLAEQKRIVAAIEKLLPLCKKFGE